MGVILLFVLGFIILVVSTSLILDQIMLKNVFIATRSCIWNVALQKGSYCCSCFYFSNSGSHNDKDDLCCNSIMVVMFFLDKFRVFS